MLSPGSAAAYRWFKITLFTLLASNAAVYVGSGTFNQALDSIAWLILLTLFGLETGFAGRFGKGRAAVAIRGARLAAAAAILAAAVGYVHEKEWLDAINIGLWIAVVGLLEFQVRHPAAVAQRRAALATAAATLYCGLGAIVLVWLWQGERFDAYDGLLWLAAFEVIEMDLLRTAHGSVAGQRA